ncbi:LysR substrate-binding domain-containing protein [Primorskyibacter aestuariivivens]|uniref:LysR substrate-binding domain-containing protein n=1 Tax=Primorskyibacter aestuariivivens TaxID=1888912 RepID=UPI002300BD1A|nr:LysR substrate-binding domain-containing protein [Primorskyibacter aestuariivivens]MDA7430546.1 LysR substrate-binding domain-containing protein [Primorskyibacter aestuariivivens]
MDFDAHLRLRHVRTFLEIARAESVSTAAARLNISQPAVSRSLKELEEMLATPLFDRVGRGLRLNEAGRVFQAHASASMVELMQARDRLTKDGDLTSRLSVGVLPTAASELVPSAALAFRKEIPSARLHILTGPNWLLFDELRAGRVDLVVGRMPEREKATGIMFQQLYIEDVVLVCRPGHAILSARVPEDHISDSDLILPPPGAVIAPTVERYLASIGLPEMRAALETVALPVGRKIVGSSDALWFISRGVVADELAAGSLVVVPLASPLLSGPVGISIARSAPISVERSVFASRLRHAAAELRPAYASGTRR